MEKSSRKCLQALSTTAKSKARVLSWGLPCLRAQSISYHGPSSSATEYWRKHCRMRISSLQGDHLSWFAWDCPSVRRVLVSGISSIPNSLGWLATGPAPLKSNFEPRKQEDDYLLCACYIPGTWLGSLHVEAVS